MPEWMWIIIAIGGSITLGVILVTIAKRGVKASHGKTSIVIAGQYQSPDDPLNAALLYVQRSTPEIQHVIFQRYLKLLKDAGANVDFLADYDDARFVRVLLRYLVNGGNGSRSIQKIIEEEMIHGEWKRQNDNLREFVEAEVWPPILRAAKDLLNQEYDSDVLEPDGTRRLRMVSNTDFVDAMGSETMKIAVVDKIVPLFSYSRACIAGGCTE